MYGILTVLVCVSVLWAVWILAVSCCVSVRDTNCSGCVSVRWAVWILAVLVVSVCGILTSCCVSVLWAVWILGVLVSVCVGLAGYPEEAEQFGHRTGSSCSVLLYVHKP